MIKTLNQGVMWPQTMTLTLKQGNMWPPAMTSTLQQDVMWQPDMTLTLKQGVVHTALRSVSLVWGDRSYYRNSAPFISPDSQNISHMLTSVRSYAEWRFQTPRLKAMFIWRGQRSLLQNCCTFMGYLKSSAKYYFHSVLQKSWIKINFSDANKSLVRPLWIYLASVFSCLYCWVLIFILYPFYMLICMYLEIVQG